MNVVRPGHNNSRLFMEFYVCVRNSLLFITLSTPKLVNDLPSRPMHPCITPLNICTHLCDVLSCRDYIFSPLYIHMTPLINILRPASLTMVQSCEYLTVYAVHAHLHANCNDYCTWTCGPRLR